eukprot:1969480-Pleurochrysis_carterae.AAC.2
MRVDRMRCSCDAGASAYTCDAHLAHAAHAAHSTCMDAAAFVQARAPPMGSIRLVKCRAAACGASGACRSVLRVRVARLARFERVERALALGEGGRLGGDHRFKGVHLREDEQLRRAQAVLDLAARGRLGRVQLRKHVHELSGRQHAAAASKSG